MALTIVLMCLASLPALCQTDPETPSPGTAPAPIVVPAVSDEKTIETPPDTTLPDDIRGDSLVARVRFYAENRHNIFARMLKAMLVRYRDTATNTLSNNTFSYDKYDHWKGRIIRRIEVRVLEPFGPSVNYPTREPTSVLEQTGNRMHIKTRAFIVRNRLLFRTGDRLEPFRLSETERLLRQSSFIYDARINLRRVRGNKKSNDSIDVIVIAHDLWSISGGGSLISINSFSINGSDANFLGMGSQLSAGVLVGPSYWHGSNWGASYILNNIGNTYTTASLFRYGYGNSTLQGIGINRDFFSAITRFAGGFTSSTEDRRDFAPTDTFSRRPMYTSYARQDLWAGIASDPFNDAQIDKERNYITSARIIRTDYSKIPWSDSLHNRQNNITFLGSVGFLKRRYFKDQFILGLGRTEDVPTGFQAFMTAGIQKGDFRDRPYLGFRTAYADYGGKYGFIYGLLQTGMYRDNGNWSDRLLSGSLLYFTPLVRMRRWRTRYFAIGRYRHLAGNYLPDTYLNLNNNDGIRGFSAGTAYGSRTAVLNLEANLYPPLTIAGFRFGVVLFADFGGKKIIKLHVSS
ncbi:MAG: hypothetical protein V4543_10135, partial [Bacteroidota bacterium]